MRIVCFRGGPAGLYFALLAKVRAVAVASKERLSAAPEIPTAREAGMPDVVLRNWWGLAVPKCTDPVVVRRIAEVFRAVLGNR